MAASQTKLQEVREDGFVGSNGESEGEEISRSKALTTARSRLGWRLLGMVFPRLTLHEGQRELGMATSFMIILSLYVSHFISSWGDRMWQFVAAILLTILYPGSLLMPGVLGFTVQLSVAIFGSAVGEWVDNTPRIKVLWMSLLIQNGLIAITAVGLAGMFALGWNVCLNSLMFGVLTATVVLLSSAAELATTSNTIAIERDWVVVIADNDEDTLATLNSNMRRIDLICKLLAPAVIGVFLARTGGFITNIFVAVWNVVSFFAEFSLVWLVYYSIPPLATKKYSQASSEKLLQFVDDDGSGEGGRGGAGRRRGSLEGVLRIRDGCLGILATFFKNWITFLRHPTALAAVSIAVLFVTVLGFSGVTTTYLLTQGTRSDLIGVYQGIGAIVGVAGTMAYPFIRSRIGTVRTGIFGITYTLLFVGVFTGIAAFIPSQRVASKSTQYWSADCSGFLGTNVSSSVPQPSFSCLAPPTPSSSPSPFPSPFTALLHSSPVATPTHPQPSSSQWSTGHAPTPTPTDSRPLAAAHPTPSPPPTLPYCSPTPAPEEGGGVSVALALLITGVISYRFGLWIFDLSVNQIIQENVAEEQRGVVSGVMNSIISIMDMLHYVLVIVAPRPENFGILIWISIGFVTAGTVMYYAYARKVRGPLNLRRYCQRCGQTGKKGEGFEEIK